MYTLFPLRRKPPPPPVQEETSESTSPSVSSLTLQKNKILRWLSLCIKLSLCDNPST